MKKGIIGGALLFATACGTSEPGEGGSVDAALDAGVDTAVGAETDGAATDTVGADVGALDAGDVGAGDVGAGDVGTVDAGPPDAGLMDAAVVDGGVWVPDTWKSDAGAEDAQADASPPVDAATDTGCDKPSASDAPQMIGTPCAQAFQAVCDDKGQVVIMCQGGKWQTWTGGMCGCMHTKCGPDQASCIAVGFVGITRAGRARKVGRVVRLYG